MGCSIFKPYTYEVCIREAEQPSKIAHNQLLGIADTAAVSVEGQILESENDEEIFLATMILRNDSINKSFKQVVDSSGRFHFSVEPGIYRLQVNSIGYTSLDTSLTFKSGEIRDLEVVLGTAGVYTMYEIESRKKLNSEELDRMAWELSE